MFHHNQFDLHIYSQKFLRHLKRQKYSDETISGYAKDLKKFNEFIFTSYEGRVFTEELQKEDILDYLTYLDEQGLKSSSIARNLSTLKSFYKFLVYEMDFKIDVAARIKHPKVHSQLPNVLDFEEVQRLLQAAKEYSEFYHVFFSLIYYTGSRITPIRVLPKEDIDLKNKKLYLSKTKNGHDLYLPLNEKLCELLEFFLAKNEHDQSTFVFRSPRSIHQPVSASDARKNLKKIVQLAGIEKRVTPHTLRHCTATHLTLRGVDQKYIASILGHRDLRSTARYQQLKVEDLRECVDKL
ncbi:tyrosine-type recombinase/integrase [Bacillus tianshenii]|nr:tyrosine-type recombinase/integrase [Bacillus tianshenii]